MICYDTNIFNYFWYGCGAGLVIFAVIVLCNYKY